MWFVVGINLCGCGFYKWLVKIGIVLCLGSDLLKYGYFVFWLVVV